MTLAQLADSFTLISIETNKNLLIIGGIFLLVWGVFFISIFVKKILYFGIIPRRIYGLPGIILAPLLHANFDHLFFNSIPLLILSDFLLFNGYEFYCWVTGMITLISGFLIWCFAKPGIHLGASAVVTGYWGFLVCNAYQQGTMVAIILGIICLYYFSWVFLSIFQFKKGVSWEGHCFGLLAGLITNYLYSTLVV